TQIIQDFNLYPDLIDKVPFEAVVAGFLDSYTLEYTYTSVAAKGGRTDEVLSGFDFTFEHVSPQAAFQLTNELAGRFVKQYARFRANAAFSTSTFFDDERLRLKQEIAEIDRELSVFKEQNVKELPDFFQLNYKMADDLRSELFNIDQELRFLRGQRRNLESSLSTLNPLIAMEGVSGQRIITSEERLAALKAELSVLRATYSEKHPNIVRARLEIKLLEDMSAQRASKEGVETLEHKPDPIAEMLGLSADSFSGAYNPTFVRTLTEIKEIELEIESLINKRLKKETEKQEYEQRVARTPFVEKQYNVIVRDLQSAQQRFNDLSAQVLKMETAEALEQQEMGGKLIIGKPASFPFKPSKPNRPLIVCGAVLAGLGIGVLLLLGWDMLTQKVRTAADMTQIADIPVLAEVPFIITTAKKKFGSYTKLIGPAVFLLVVWVVIYFVHNYYYEVDILFVKIFNALKIKLTLLGF
ncbi:MAG: hypothetical protein GY868_13080, partial [Deltaproteobacteria bacterium]|nr:hypothetical protein [Deltaproteobacteria bacterium]